VAMSSPRVMDDHERALHAALRKLREKAGLTQDEVARALGGSRAQIMRIENTRVIRYDELLVVLDLYMVPVDQRAPYFDLWERAWPSDRRRPMRPDRIGTRSVPRQGADQGGDS
jgi:transcriptional regulator with XRE-family HTH domain